MIDRITIQATDPNRVFRPGETVSGSVEWHLDDEPEVVEVTLFWFTQGRGDRDAGIAHTLRIEAPPNRGAQDFEFDLPLGPYTFSGRLISLIWSLEAVVLPSQLTSRTEIVVSPGEGEVTLAPSPA